MKEEQISCVIIILEFFFNGFNAGRLSSPLFPLISSYRDENWKYYFSGTVWAVIMQSILNRGVVSRNMTVHEIYELNVYALNSCQRNIYVYVSIILSLIVLKHYHLLWFTCYKWYSKNLYSLNIFQKKSVKMLTL